MVSRFNNRRRAFALNKKEVTLGDLKKIAAELHKNTGSMILGLDGKWYYQVHELPQHDALPARSLLTIEGLNEAN